MRQNIKHEEIGGTLFLNYWDFIIYSWALFLSKKFFSTNVTLVLIQRKAVRFKNTKPTQINMTSAGFRKEIGMTSHPPTPLKPFCVNHFSIWLKFKCPVKNICLFHCKRKVQKIHQHRFDSCVYLIPKTCWCLFTLPNSFNQLFFV